MKKRLTVIVLGLFTICGIAYCADRVLPPYPVTFELSVTDGEGNPVGEADVELGSVTKKVWEHWEGYDIHGSTDASGKYVVDLKTSYFFAGQVKKKGYYSRGTGDIYYGQELGRQEKVHGSHLTIKRDLIMRKILNPVPLVYNSQTHRISVVDTKMGFDLEKMDWVKPYGKGEKADFYFEQNGYWKDESGYDATLTISFPNEGDGIFAFNRDVDEWRFAPEGGYAPTMTWKTKMDVNESSSEMINELGDLKKNYFLRVRTTLDNEGKVTKANYVYIGLRPQMEPFHVSSGKSERKYGEINLHFSFNPEVNNRSLESGKGTKIMENGEEKKPNPTYKRTPRINVKRDENGNLVVVDEEPKPKPDSEK